MSRVITVVYPIAGAGTDRRRNVVITATVIGFYTLDTARLLKCRDIQRFGIIYFTVFSFMPIPLVLAARFIRTPAKAKFGKMGTTMHKVIIVIIASLLLSEFPPGTHREIDC